MVTHDLDSLYAICDRVAVLGHGKVSRSVRLTNCCDPRILGSNSYFHGKRGVVRAGAAEKGRDERAGNEQAQDARR